MFRPDFRGSSALRFSPSGLGVWLALYALVTAGACGAGDPASVKADAVRRADTLVGKNQDRDAIRAYLAAIDADPRDGEIRLKVAKAYMRTGQWGEAAAQAIRASDLLPGNREARLLGLSMMLSSGRYVDAAEGSVILLRENADDVDALILRGNATARMLNSTWAMWTLDEAARRGKDLDRARGEIRPLTTRLEDEAAEKLFQRALHVAPNSDEAQFALINLYWAGGRPELGETLLKGIADRYPGHGLANRSLAAFYVSQGRDGEAEAHLKRAAPSEDRDTRLALADFYLARNRGAEALTMLEAMAAGDDSTSPPRSVWPTSSGAVAGTVKPCDGSTRCSPARPITRARSC